MNESIRHFEAEKVVIKETAKNTMERRIALDFVRSCGAQGEAAARAAVMLAECIARDKRKGRAA